MPVATATSDPRVEVQVVVIEGATQMQAFAVHTPALHPPRPGTRQVRVASNTVIGLSGRFARFDPATRALVLEEDVDAAETSRGRLPLVIAPTCTVRLRDHRLGRPSDLVAGDRLALWCTPQATHLAVTSIEVRLEEPPIVRDPRTGALPEGYFITGVRDTPFPPDGCSSMPITVTLDGGHVRRHVWVDPQPYPTADEGRTAAARQYDEETWDVDYGQTFRHAQFERARREAQLNRP